MVFSLQIFRYRAEHCRHRRRAAAATHTYNAAAALHFTHSDTLFPVILFYYYVFTHKRALIFCNSSVILFIFTLQPKYAYHMLNAHVPHILPFLSSFLCSLLFFTFSAFCCVQHNCCSSLRAHCDELVWLYAVLRFQTYRYFCNISQNQDKPLELSFMRNFQPNRMTFGITLKRKLN